MRRARSAVLVALGALAAGGSAPVSAAPGEPAMAVWAWGMNHRGQLGFASSNYYVPGEVPGLDDVIAVTNGDSHTVALKSDGTVWAWGANEFGQLGFSGADFSFAPVVVAGLDNIVEVAAGNTHTLARRSDGVVFAWGGNAFGQLGVPITTVSSTVPVQVSISAVTRIAAGGSHSMAIDDNGVAWAWGSNLSGQLGDGTVANTSGPVQILVADVVGIAGGAQHALALDSHGDVWVWGLNGFGQLGRGFQGSFTQPFPVPERVPGPSNIAAIAAGDLHNLAVTAEGRVWVWGYNSVGQAGIGETTAANTGLLDAIELDLEDIVSVSGGDVFSLALTNDGDVYAWGAGLRGAVGNNRVGNSLVPERVAQGATAIAAGGGHTVVLAPSRGGLTVSAVGQNDDAQLGDGTWVDASSLVPALVDLELQRVSAGASHGLGVDVDGLVWAWGSNEHGQLGVLGGDRPLPVSVSVPLEPQQRVVDVAAGVAHSLALRSDGAVFAWGRGHLGQLGTGATADAPTPVRVVGLGPAIGVAAGDNHSLAIDSSRRVHGWGNDQCGQLGVDGNGDFSPLPVSAGLDLAFQITAGSCHSAAIRARGNVYAWGRNGRAELGDGSLRSRKQPEPVLLPTGATVISAGSLHTLSIVEGEAWGWGRTREGQVGGDAYAWEPQRISGMGELVDINAGSFHSLAVGAEGTVWGWGDRARGQLPIDPAGASMVPIPMTTAARSVHAGAWHSLIGF